LQPPRAIVTLFTKQATFFATTFISNNKKTTTMASVLLVSFLSLAGAGFAHPSAPLITPAPVVGRQSINVAVPEFCEKKSQVSSCFDRLGAQEKLDECQGSKDDTCLCAGYAAVDA